MIRNGFYAKISSSLFEQYREPFIRFAFSYVRDINKAEDIFMEAFMLYWEKRENLPQDTNVPAYLLTTIKNKSLNLLRDEQARNTIQEKIHEHETRELNFRISTLEACEPEELFSNELKKLINETMQDLPDQTRKIFTKSRHEAKTNKEIAAELDVSIKTVEFHISKALKIFRVKLKDYLPFLTLLLQINL